MSVYGHALLLLSKRNYFEAELRNKLNAKFPDEDLCETIESLKAAHYLDDERTLVFYVRRQVETGHGPYYIREKLRTKGVECSVRKIMQVIEAEEIDLDEVVRKLAEKYIGRNIKKPIRTLTKNCAAYLAGRGFDVSGILKIIKEVTKDEGDFSEGC